MATLDEITQGAMRRWLDGPAAVEIASITQFDVPGVEVASRIKKLDPGIRETLELVSKGMSFLSEGEQHDGENRRLRIRMLSGGKEQKHCELVTAAGRRFAYSRDGRRFGRLRSASSPVETELAIRPLLEHDLGDAWTQTPQGAWRARLDADDFAAVVDLERILGPRGRAVPSGFVEARCGEDDAELLIRRRGEQRHPQPPAADAQGRPRDPDAGDQHVDPRRGDAATVLLAPGGEPARTQTPALTDASVHPDAHFACARSVYVQLSLRPAKRMATRGSDIESK
jgi:hypothetical protein